VSNVEVGIFPFILKY